MSTANRIIKNTGFLYMRTVVSLLLSVFTTRFLLEGLGVENYGLYNVVGGAISMLGFINASMSSVTQRFISYAEGHGDKQHIIKIFNNSVLIHRTLALISVTILLIAGLFFFNGILNIPEGKMTDAVFIYGCLLFSTAFSITVVPYSAEINAHEDMFVYALTGVADVVLKFLIAFSILYINTDKLIVYAVLMAFEAFLIRYIIQVYCQKRYVECRNTRIRECYDKGLVKEMISFSGWNLLNIGSGMISLFGMNVVINHYFGVELNAAMGVATQLTGVLTGLSTNMVNAITPALVKAEGGHKRERANMLSLTACKISFFLFSFFGIPFMTFITPILRLWLKTVPEWASIFCVILLLSTLLEQLTVVLYQSIMAEGRIKKYNIIRSVTNILPIIISVIMFHFGDFQPYWILINWLIWKAVAGGFVNLYFSHKNLGIKYQTYAKQVILPSSIIFGATVLLNYGIHLIDKNPSVLVLIILVTLSLLISIPVYYVGGLSKNEKQYLLKFAKR